MVFSLLYVLKYSIHYLVQPLPTPVRKVRTGGKYRCFHLAEVVVVV
jgi:hypothetical protein